MCRYIILVVFSLMLSCGQKPAELSDNKDLLPADFDQFFKKFKEDSSFQIQRVKFPWRIYVNYDDRSDFEETKKGKWRYSKFYYTQSYSSREEDAYTQELRSYGDTIKLELRGIDNGIYIDYDFAKINGEWFLVSGKDFSD